MLSKFFVFLSLFASLVFSSTLVKRGSYSQVTSFGSNPSNTLMYIYVPTNLAAKPAVIVAIHYCTGTAQAYYTSTQYAQLAETYGYIVIYPQSPYSGTCWDVSSKSALTHNGGGDSNSIANMVTWTLNKYNGDAGRVFVTGSSSGAMMTNVMAATYPNLFAAATVYSGVPAACFFSSSNQVDAWNSTCAQGHSNASPALWASIVKDMYPGYSGSRPPMRIYHGDADTTLYPQNYNETVKEWSGVFGYDYTRPVSTQANTPASRYTTYTFGPNLQGVYANGVGHTVPVRATDDLMWFGIIGGKIGGGGSGTGSPTTTATITSKPTTTAATTSANPTTTSDGGSTGETVAQWGQCGGIGYKGPTVCASPYTCHKGNDYYSQCY